jgi:CDP-diacylglycerol---glycerol-3-phosphate 3-phosphatidyltransferase
MRPLTLIFGAWQHTLANYITLARMALWTIALLFYWYWWAPLTVLSLCVISALLDGIDGYVARRFNQTSVCGALLDPLVDKYCGWSLILALAHHFATRADSISCILASTALVPIGLFALYDYAAVHVRGTDEAMITNDKAKEKQGVLFASLMLLLVSVVLYDIASYQFLYWIVLVLGILGLWKSLYLTTASARVYFSLSRDPRAKEWSDSPLIRFILKTF